VRRAAEENGDRHEIGVDVGMGGGRGDQLHQVARRARGMAAGEQARGPDQFEVGLVGTGQPQRGAHDAQHREIGLTLAFQDIADGTSPRRDRGRGVIRA